MSGTTKSKRDYIEMIEVATVGLCLLAIVVLCYNYLSADDFENARISFESSLEAWDKGIASSSGR